MFRYSCLQMGPATVLCQYTRAPHSRTYTKNYFLVCYSVLQYTYAEPSFLAMNEMRSRQRRE